MMPAPLSHINMIAEFARLPGCHIASEARGGTPADQANVAVGEYLRRNRERVEIDDAPCKNEDFTVVDVDGSCLRCGAEQGEFCRS